MNTLHKYFISILLVYGVAGCGSDSMSVKVEDQPASKTYDVVDADVEDGDAGGSKGDVNVDPTNGDNHPEDPDKRNPTDDPTNAPIEIEWPESIEDFYASVNSISIIDHLKLPTSEDDGAYCCRDFGDISKRPGPDNAIAGLNRKLQELMAEKTGRNPHDPNDVLERYFSERQLTLLVDQRGFDTVETPDGPPVQRFVSSLIYATYSGESDYYLLDPQYNRRLYLDPNSFVMAEASKKHVVTGTPRVVANPTIVRDHIGTADFPEIVKLPVAIGSIVLELPVEQLKMTAKLDIAPTPYGNVVRYEEGGISGYIRTSEIFAALNDYARDFCSCDPKAEPLFSQDRDGNWKGNCNDPSYYACDEKFTQACRDLVFSDRRSVNEQCSVLPAWIQNSADIDLDGPAESDDQPQTWDALSIGYFWFVQPAAQ